MWYVTDWFFAVNVHGRRLSLGNRAESFYLSFVEMGVSAKVLQTNFVVIYSVEFRKCPDCIMPPAILLAFVRTPYADLTFLFYLLLRHLGSEVP